MQENESLVEFFHEEIVKAQKRQGLPLQLETQFYVVNLLSEFLRLEKLYPTQKDGTIQDEPIALMYARAMMAQSSLEQMQIFKTIGDRTLYVSGFFSDSFKGKIIDVDYYISMGEQAYGSVSSLCKEKNVFEELSEKFEKLVNIVSEISETSGVTSDTDLLRLYERWLLTKSEHLSEKLRQAGIIPTDTKKDPIH